MYLSRISLTPALRSQPHHRLVMAGFPETDAPSPRASWQILYRAEGDRLLVQSAIAPDWSNVLPPSVPVATKQVEPRYEAGCRYRFRLAFNSVSRYKGNDKFLDPVDWLTRRDFGGEITHGTPTVETVSDVSSTGHRVVLRRATVDGTILVTDVDRLMHVVTHGIGRGRAYGCGMLSVA
jgi:CRISPR system Cascade subunit CasE